MKNFWLKNIIKAESCTSSRKTTDIYLQRSGVCITHWSSYISNSFFSYLPTLWDGECAKIIKNTQKIALKLQFVSVQLLYVNLAACCYLWVHPASRQFKVFKWIVIKKKQKAQNAGLDTSIKIISNQNHNTDFFFFFKERLFLSKNTNFFHHNTKKMKQIIRDSQMLLKFINRGTKWDTLIVDKRECEIKTNITIIIAVRSG